MLNTCVCYSVHADDAHAIYALKRLELALGWNLLNSGVEDDVTRHIQIHMIVGSEPACAPHHTVSLFSTSRMRFPDEFIQIRRVKNKATFASCTPKWAVSTERLAAVSTRANPLRTDIRGRNKFDRALILMHRDHGGWSPAKKSRLSVHEGKTRKREHTMSL